MPESPPLPLRAGRDWHSLYELAALVPLFALHAHGSLALLPGWLPWLALLVTWFLVAGPTRSPTPNASPPALSTVLLRRLRLLALVAAIAAGLWLLVFEIAPAAIARTLTAWLALSGIFWLARPAHRAARAPWNRLRRSPRTWHVLEISGETLLLAGVTAVAARYWTAVWVDASPLAQLVPTVAWLSVRLSLSRAGVVAPTLARWGFGAVLAVPLTAALLLPLGVRPSGGLLVPAGWALIALLVVHLTRERVTIAERARWLAVGAGALFLMNGFARPEIQGTGDAVWYGMMLADMLEQTRAGEYPVFVGQSLYQFNGALYPLRVAPAFHHLGALTDVLSGRTLPASAVMNLFILAWGIFTAAVTYACLARLMPAHRSAAAAGALLFLACPGVLSVAYNTDLYMSWATLPALPLVWWASVSSFRQARLAHMVTLGAALGWLWWGHSPIALWTSLLAIAFQAVRVTVAFPNLAQWAHACLGATIALVIAAYPIGSVLFFPPEPGIDASGFQHATADTVVHFLREVFPAVLLPLSDAGRALADFQLGYVLWAMLALAVFNLRRAPVAARACTLLAVTIVLLLTPGFGLELKLWEIMPARIRDTTGNWVMNRLYVILAGLVVFAWATHLGRSAGADSRGSLRLALPLLVALAWSGLEATKFHRGSTNAASASANSLAALQPENIAITRFAYLVFPALPGNFTHGVTSPQLEQRLLEPETFEPLLDVGTVAWENSTLEQEAAFVAADPTARSSTLDVPLLLAPDETYLLEFPSLPAADLEGTLIFEGPTLHRVYALPEYGGPRSFGIGESRRAWLPLFTSAPAGEAVRVSFVPSDASFNSAAGSVLPGPVNLRRYTEADLPVQMRGWIPYQARVQSPTPAWLETPRSYQSAYRATVNGRPAEVARTPEGLVAVAVPAGESEVELRYVAPTVLRALYWLSLASLLATSVAAVTALGRKTPQVTQP